jgi:hypothetical protein
MLIAADTFFSLPSSFDLTQTIVLLQTPAVVPASCCCCPIFNYCHRGKSFSTIRMLVNTKIAKLVFLDVLQVEDKKFLVAFRAGGS